MTPHPLEHVSLEHLEEDVEQAFATLDPDIFLNGGEARYRLIQEAQQAFKGGGLIGNIHRALLTGQARSLRTVQLLAMRGYPQDAASVTRTALERAFHQAYIDQDVSRAEKWVYHTDEARNFEQHFNCVDSTFRRWYHGDNQATIKALVDGEMDLYRQVSAYAHGNPAVTKGLDLRTIEGEATWTPMPSFTAEGFVRCARIMVATHRCAEIGLMATVFARSRSRPEVDAWVGRVNILSQSREAAICRLDALEASGERWNTIERQLQEALSSVENGKRRFAEWTTLGGGSGR